MVLKLTHNIPAFWKVLLLGMAIAFDVAVIPGLIYGQGSFYTWNMLKEKKAAVEDELADLNKRRTSLSREIRLLKTDPAYVEKVIRQRLKFVKKNEILYLFDKQTPASVWGGTGSDGMHE